MSIDCINIISECIECKMMDVKNIAFIIYNYSSLTPLQLSFKKFCEEKSLPDRSEYNDFKILKSIKNPDKDSTFSGYYKPHDFIPYCDKKTKREILNYLLKSISFKFFNASLLLSIYPEDYGCIDTSLLNAEQTFDMFDCELNEDDYFEAIDNSVVLNVLLYEFCNGNLSILKKKIDSIFNSDSKIDKEMYERIWQRAFDFSE